MENHRKPRKVDGGEDEASLSLAVFAGVSHLALLHSSNCHANEAREEHRTMIEHKRSLSATSCTPIEEDEFESLEELDWLLSFDQGCKFTAKERMAIKRRASEMEITPNKR
jgi:hexokinase